MGNNILIYSIILILYHVSLFITGLTIIRRWFHTLDTLFEYTGAFLLGFGIGIPTTYFLTCIFSFFTKEPILFSEIAAIVLSIWIFIKYPLDTSHGNRKVTVYDFILLIFSLFFSTWIMGKTFRGGPDGQLFVGSNTIFDFGLFLGLVRSMAWGGNIPLMSPFNSGQPFFYHFLFQFWVSLWEYARIPTVFVVNIPSVLSFSALLIIIYYLPQMVLKKGKLVGWITVLLTITHSTLTFWHLLLQKGITMQFLTDIWRLPTYPFAGPFDGATISLYTTLNSYVNQRHLSFAGALGLLLSMLVMRRLEQKRLSIRISLCIGFLTGLMFLWNMATCMIAAVLIAFLIALHRSWRELFFFLVGCAVFLIISFAPYIPYFIHTVIAVGRMVGGTYGMGRAAPTWILGQYLWENFGILPLVILFGFIILPKKRIVFFLPFLIFFIVECLLAGVGKRGFDQKFYSFLIIGVNVIAAVGIVWLWEKRIVVFRGLALVILFTVSISGIVDLMAIKNEFAFPLINKEIGPVISWIKNKTPKNAVFVSYSDIIDPVVLSGRKNYFGFYGNVGWTDRSSDVKNMYAGDIATARALGISYILAPNWKKDDFPYTVDTMFFQEHGMLVYKDEKYSIFAVK